MTTILPIVLLGLSFAEPSLFQQPKEYLCPPCGCPKDKDVFTAPGICPDCKMILVPKEAGSNQPATPTGPLTAENDHVKSAVRQIWKLSEGVYAIRHQDAPDGFPQSNTLVAIGSKAVLVVDSCYMPSSARADIEQIRKWTDKPIKYLVNTHWHFDHTIGNAEYASVFPGLKIIAQTETAKQSKGYNAPWLERYPVCTQQFKDILATGKEDGEDITQERRSAVEGIVQAREQVQSEFSVLKDVNPNVSFTDEMTVDLGGRIVKIMHIGRGNTAGDAIVYLPKERIVASGDLVDHPIPYLAGGYPNDEVRTLQRLVAMDFKTLVPGHGSVLTDKGYINLIIDFMKAVIHFVNVETYRLGNGSTNEAAVQEAVAKWPELDAWRTKFTRNGQANRSFFDGFALPGLVRGAFTEAYRR